MHKKCSFCNLDLNSHQKKFCSNKCQADFQYREYIKRWKLNKEDGNRGINAKNISRHIKRYLFEKYKNKCTVCGWNKLNPYTKTVPLEIDHIDGNANNNKEKNLRILCPNCHSLTENFRNLNIGKGREWRKKKYKLNS